MLALIPHPRLLVTTSLVGRSAVRELSFRSRERDLECNLEFDLERLPSIDLSSFANSFTIAEISPLFEMLL